MSTNIKEEIRAYAHECGAARCGFARCEPVSQRAQQLYAQWLQAGRHGEMQYCEKYTEQRADPRTLLDGARTLISCAWAYGCPEQEASIISEYALGQDYHTVVRQRLERLAQHIREQYGGETRAVVDTAPLRERYWAQQAGVGYVGINNQLIVPGIGSRVFLGELLWTGTVEPDHPCEDTCLQCMACVRACPGKALDGKGGCDASRCVSYLTIEHRGAIPADANLGGSCYGCDACLRSCPQGNLYDNEAILPEFSIRDQVKGITAADILEMGSAAYKRLVRDSAMRRVPLPQLKRNVQHMLKVQSPESRVQSPKSRVQSPKLLVRVSPEG